MHHLQFDHLAMLVAILSVDSGRDLVLALFAKPWMALAGTSRFAAKRSHGWNDHVVLRQPDSLDLCWRNGDMVRSGEHRLWSVHWLHRLGGIHRCAAGAQRDLRDRSFKLLCHQHGYWLAAVVLDPARYWRFGTCQERPLQST